MIEYLTLNTSNKVMLWIVNCDVFWLGKIVNLICYIMCKELEIFFILIERTSKYLNTYSTSKTQITVSKLKKKT